MAENVGNNLRNLGCEVALYSGKASIKQRFIDIRSGQQIMRFDHDIMSPPFDLNEIQKDDWETANAIVISDYSKGVVSYDLICQITKLFVGPIFIDTKKQDLALFGNAFIKINELESTQVSAITNNTIVTLGSNGARFQSVMYPAPTVKVVDVTGAGDTFIAALAANYLETHNICDAIQFAVKAASISVQHSGVYAPTRNEII